MSAIPHAASHASSLGEYLPDENIPAALLLPVPEPRQEQQIRVTFDAQGREEVIAITDAVSGHDRVNRYTNGALSTTAAYDPAGELHGTARGFYPSGRTHWAGAFNHGVRAGVWATYHDNEKNSAATVTEFMHGQMHGEHKAWAPEGHQVLLETYRNGRRHGTCAAYTADGTVYRIQDYKDGYRHGRSYQNNGEVEVSGLYDEGVRHGAWIEQSAQGLVTTKIYNHGVSERPHVR